MVEELKYPQLTVFGSEDEPVVIPDEEVPEEDEEDEEEKDEEDDEEDGDDTGEFES